MPANEVSPYRGTVLRVAVPTPLRQLFDYLPPTELQSGKPLKPGIRLLVPFGRRQLVAILIDRVDQSSVPVDKLKPALRLLDEEPVFPARLFQMLLWAAEYYQHPPGEVFATALPALLRAGEPVYDEYQYWQVSAAGPDANALLQRAPRQRQLLDFVEASGRVRRGQVAAAGFDPALLNELLAKELIQAGVAREQAAGAFTPPAAEREWRLQLNPSQQRAVAGIEAQLKKPGPILLDGVTGSGKTEVYMRLIHNRLAAGRQSLVLVPEIGLTPQTISRFQDSFDCQVAVMHSGLSDRERLLAWKQAREGQAGIIIGTRSAVFTPMLNPGLIVVDEEHDSSFKQQEGFRYSARDLAVIRARDEGIPVILGSATPSLESLHNSLSGKFARMELADQAGGSAPAAMQLVDVSEQALPDGIAESVQDAMQLHLQAGNQVLVFINRRGFAPILSCQVCTWQSECRNCVAQMTVHRSPPQLRCHHCEASEAIPEFCPVCKSPDLTTFGQGTQKLQQFLEQRFPRIPLFRVDRDTTRGKDSFNRLVEKLRDAKPAILLGTQMLAKGHHFPALTLVVVIDADSGLFSADFRGQEQFSQTLIQVSGRAGRAERRGEVQIQTRHPTHPSLQKLVDEGYGGFANYLLQERRAAAMPPFSYLCLLRAEAPSMRQALAFLDSARRRARAIGEERPYRIESIGPLPAPMEKRGGRYRGQLLLKSDQRPALQDLLRQLLPEIEGLRTARGLRWSVDVDPLELI